MSIFNLEQIKKDLDSAEKEMDFDGETQKIYVGTVFNLLPSEKYYTPWANSNVGVCKACAEAGDGPCDKTSPCIPPEGYYGEKPYHCEVCRDSKWIKDASEELQTIDAYLTEGEGAPCDMFVCRRVPDELNDE